MSPIVLPRDPMSSRTEIRLTEVPRYLPPQTWGKYWHIPRSIGTSLGRRYVIRAFCGQMIFADSLDALTDKRPSELLCGSCEGRAGGWERTEGRVFRPRDHFATPERCPYYGTSEGDDHRCPVCDGKRRWRVDFAGCRESRHKAGPKLVSVKPCPAHGWKYATPRGTHLVCSVSRFNDCGWRFA